MSPPLPGITQIGIDIIYIILPILAIYIAYLILTKTFKYMGLSSIEAIIIIFVTFLFGFEIILFGVNLSNIYLFSYQNWIIGINTGGAVIPICLSIYLVIKKELSIKKVLIGILIVTVITYFVTSFDPVKGIVSYFPYWLLPAFFASIASVFLSWKIFHKTAPLAYISGTIGVLIGADFLHFLELLRYPIEENTSAVIGGAYVFDMVFMTGILAVILDGILIYSINRNK